MQHLDALRERLAEHDDTATEPYRVMLADLPTDGHGTTAEWFRARDALCVTTLQVKSDGAAWLTGPRAIDARHSTYALLDGSRRDYSGTRVLACNVDTLMIHVSGFDHVIIYRTVPRTH